MNSGHKITFRLTEAEAVDAARLVAARQLWGRPVIKILLALIALLVVLLGLLDPQALMEPILLALAGIAVVLFSTIWLAVPFHARRHFRQAAALRDEIEVSWDEEAIRFSSSHGTSNLAWREYHRWAENDRLFLFHQSQMLYNIVPKRALDEGMMADLSGRFEQAGIAKA